MPLKEKIELALFYAAIIAAFPWVLRYLDWVMTLK
jgi:hypothetical protein